MKKNKELLHSIGNIEDKYIENAQPKERLKKNKIWISSISAAACLICAAGLTYYFVIRPIDDINNYGNDPDTFVTTTEATNVTQSPQKQQNDVRYPEVNKIDMDNINSIIGLDRSGESEIRAMSCDGENIFFQDIYKSSRKDWYLSVEIEPMGQKINLPEINNITMNDISGSDACFTDDYMYILLHGGVLYSVSRTDGKVIAKQGGFHYEMDLSGYSKCLGADDHGNVYIESGDYSDDRKMLKYNPQLELVSEYRISNSVPFDKIINFDDMYTDSDDVLHCVYDDGKTVDITLFDRSVSCDDEIIKEDEDEYWYVQNENEEKPLKVYSKNYQNENRGEEYKTGTIDFIDSKINLSVEASRKVSYIQLDKNGDFVKSHDLPDGLDPFCYGFDLKKNGDILSGLYCQSERNSSPFDYFVNSYNIISGKISESFNIEDRYSNFFNMVYPFDFIADDSEYYYFSYVISDKIKDDGSTDCPLIIRYDKNTFDEVVITLDQQDKKNIYNTGLLINDNVPYVINLLQSGEKSVIYKPDFENNSYSEVAEVSGKLYPQSDGTLLCISEDKLYSYSLDSGKMAEIFNFPEGVLPADDRFSDIQKMNETSYAYISGLKFPEADQLSETSIYILSVK